jgi:hypothetical protein
MAAGNFTLYNNAKLLLLNGTLNMASAAVTAALVTSTYTPAATDTNWSAASANEVTGGNYVEQALASETVTQASGTVTVDCADIAFGSNTTITAKYLVLIAGTAGSLTGTSQLIGYCDLNTGGGSVSSTAGAFTVQTPTGLFTAT